MSKRQGWVFECDGCGAHIAFETEDEEKALAQQERHACEDCFDDEEDKK